MRCFLQILSLFALLHYSNNAALSIYEQKKYKRFLEGQGLYTPDDDVLILTVHNFQSEVMGRNYAVLVEFYNSWCGFCQRFAPSWKALATDVKGWSDFVRIGALDCSVDENSPICREYEIMAYPTLRYFHERYVPGAQNLGVSIKKGDDVQAHRRFLIQRLIIEQQEGRGAMYPHLLPYTFPDLTHLFSDTPPNTKYAFLIIENLDTTLGPEVILDLHKTPNIGIKYSFSNNTELVTKFSLEKFPVLISKDTANRYQVHQITESRSQVKEVLTRFLHEKAIEVTDETPNKEIFTGKWLEVEVPNMGDLIKEKAHQALRDRVKKMGDVVFQVDMETALRYSFRHEVASVKAIEGERLQVLKGYLGLLRKYFPFGPNGKLFLTELVMAVSDTGSVPGASIASVLTRAEAENSQVFSSKQQWLGCRGSAAGKRGYPCGLWKLFHYLTVNSAEQSSNNPLEVLDVMHGYIKNFFGCQDCSQHFQDMAAKRELRNVSSLDSAVIWLWMAHNEVNKRLAGDQTEDPIFPKIQFPDPELCPLCRHGNSTWNLSEVLKYLKHVYSNLNVRYIGSDTTILHGGLEHAATSGGSMFRSLDMSMCFILYVVSFLFLALLIRIFLKRGYKKKPYIHDLLGKV